MSARRFTCTALLAIVVLASNAASGQKPGDVTPPDAPTPTRALRVLLVGNSYMYTHNMHEVVASVAGARGFEILPGLLAEPNYSIEDHVRSGRFEPMLDRGWDWVVMHQGPSSLPENQIYLRYWTGVAAAAARARGIKVALMSAWPAEENAHTWLNAELSYRNAALAHDVCVLPVATAWRLARERQPSIRLYQRDQLHPEREGTLLAAQVIANGLMNQPLFADAADLREMIPESDWRQALSRSATLEQIANEVLQEQGPRCNLAKRAPPRN